MADEVERIPLKTGDNDGKLGGNRPLSSSKSNLMGSRGNLFGASKAFGSMKNLLGRKSTSMMLDPVPPPPAPATNAIIYENTYKMKPDTKFGAGKVTAIIKATLQKTLNGKKYEAEKVPELITSISNEILAEVKKLGYERYKIVVQVDVGEFKGQGIKLASRCVWDTTTDTWASGSFKNATLFAVAMVFEVTSENEQTMGLCICTILAALNKTFSSNNMIKQDKALENNAYYPHTQIRKFKSSKDYQAKETVYSLRNLQEINTLASETPVIDTRADIFKEKKELHEKSLGKIKGWGNTIMGARNKRLAAAKEKAQAAEAERKRLDAEWAEVAERERQEALRRSRMMQKSEEPRFRNLHSQMLLSNVLMERDKQLEYKFHKAIAEKIHEKEEVLNMRLQYLKSLEKEKQRQEMNMEKRLSFARGLKTAVDKRDGKRQDLSAERERGNKLAAEIRQEFEKEAILQRQKKLAEASQIKQTLADQILQKKNALNELQMNSLEMEESNYRFNEMKNLLAEKRKEFTYKQATFRMMRSEEVAKEFVKSNMEADENRSAFLSAMQQSHDAQIQERESKKAHDRLQFLTEKEIFEQNHKTKKLLVAEEEKLQKAKERLHYKQQAQQWKREALEIAEKKKQRLLGIKEEQIEQMKYHQGQKSVHLDEGIKHDAASKLQMQKDNAEFDEYAASVIEEWSRSGRNVGPILNIIEKERPGYTKARGGPKELDHFSRLGFVGRHLTYDAAPEIMLETLKALKEKLYLSLSSENKSLVISSEPSHLDDWKVLYAQIKSFLQANEGNTSENGFIIIDDPLERLIEEIVPLFFQLWHKKNKVDNSYFLIYVQLQKLQDDLVAFQSNGLFTRYILDGIKIKLLAAHSAIEAIASPTQDCYQQGKEILIAKHRICTLSLHSLLKEMDALSPALLAIHQRLIEIKIELQGLLARKNPHAFSLTQVQVLQEELREIDSARIDGKFIAKDGSVVAGQGLIIHLLEAGFDDCHELLASKDPVDGDNPLRNTYEELIKIKQHLERLASFPAWTLRSDDLIPYQVKLGQIDNMRVDGKFLIKGSIEVPPGQAVLHFLLHKCYRLIHKLQNEIEPVSDNLLQVFNQLQTLKKCLQQLVKWNVELSVVEIVPYEMKLQSILNSTNVTDLEQEGEEEAGIISGIMKECRQLLDTLSLSNN